MQWHKFSHNILKLASWLSRSLSTYIIFSILILYLHYFFLKKSKNKCMYFDSAFKEITSSVVDISNYILISISLISDFTFIISFVS